MASSSSFPLAVDISPGLCKQPCFLQNVKTFLPFNFPTACQKAKVLGNVDSKGKQVM